MSHSQSPHTTQEFIFTTAPFASSHASTIVELRNGDLLAAWFGGTHENAPDVAIWASRRTAGNWSAPFELVREPNIACWNPVLFHSADGKLWLYYKFGPNARTWTGARLVSTDEAHTWSQPEHLPAGLLGPIKDKPLVLDDGTIVSGTSVESYSSWAAWIERSIDNGKHMDEDRAHHRTLPTATITTHPDRTSLRNHPTHHRPSGQQTSSPLRPLHLEHRPHLRSRLIRQRPHLDTAHPTDLPNPNSGIDAVGLRDGRIVLIYNNTTKGRTPLNLAVSADGEHFKIFATLEDQPGEYSYPAIIQAKAGELDITYTWNRKRIRFATIPLAMTGAP